MILDETLEIPELADIIKEHEENMRPILGMSAVDEIAPESVAGQMVSQFSQIDYEIFLSIQALISQMNANTATGNYLDIMANIRGLSRKAGESDDDLRTRITGVSSAGTHSVVSVLEAQLRNIAGVTDANVVYRNNQIYPIVTGGDDNDIASVLRDYAPIGELKGNNTYSLDCVNYTWTRAVRRPVTIRIKIDVGNSFCRCNNEDIQKAIDIIMDEGCKYTAGGTMFAGDIKDLLGRNGFVASEVSFSLEATGQLNLNAPPAPVVDDACADNGDFNNWLNQACLNAVCEPISGTDLLLPSNITPVMCRDKILVSVG